jgi:hypothetical protein
MSLPADRPRGQIRYERLISLSVRHDFYGAGKACPDFAITPTASTKTLLRNLGLIAKPRRDGIDVLYFTGRTAAILRYLWNRKHDHQTSHWSEFDLPRMRSASWTRLTLAFRLDNPLFTNFTEMPSPVRPGTHCLYVSNRATSLSGSAKPMSVDWSNVIALNEATFSAAHLRIPTPADAVRAVIHDTSGRAILIADRSHDQAASSRTGTQGSSEIRRRIGLLPGKDINLDMSIEPAGLYSYMITTDSSSRETAFLYPGKQDTPLLMVDLFFDDCDNPTRDGKGFPVRLPDELPDTLSDSDAERHFTPAEYEIHFKARKTIWTYYIVLPEGTSSNGLCIEPASPHAPAFEGPDPVTLPTGAVAHRFSAKTACALQSRSDVALRLRGARAHAGGATRILLERLPLPSAESMPAPQPRDRPARSDVFVYL